MAQHLAECQAHVMIVVLDTRANWFPLVRRATVQPLKVAPKAAGGFFQRPGPDGTAAPQTVKDGVRSNFTLF